MKRRPNLFLRVQEREGHGYKQPQSQSCVPPLPLAEASRGPGGVFLPPAGLPASESLEGQIAGRGWRRLARENLGQKFLERVKNPRRANVHGVTVLELYMITLYM